MTAEDTSDNATPDVDPQTQYDHDLKIWATSAPVMMAGQMEFAKLAIRGVTLINGGAALALLAFLGHVVAAATSGTGAGIKLSVAADLMPSMILFMGGATAGVVTAALAYVTQSLFTEGNGSPRAKKWAGGIRYAAVATGLAGIIAFGVGGYFATAAFISAFPTP